MKGIAISDLHLLSQNPVCRLDDLTKTQDKKLSFLLSYAGEFNYPIFSTGDFTNTPRNWYLLSKLMKYMIGGGNVEGDKLDIFSVFGQHDTYLYSEETKPATNLGLLIESGCVTELTSTPYEYFDGNKMHHFYGCSFGQNIPEVQDSSCYNVLVIHAGIGDKELYPGDTSQNAETFLRIHREFNLILCGDIHRKFKYSDKDRLILNSGPMLRKTADKYSFQHKPGFWVFDTKDSSNLEWVEIPCAEAVEVLTRDHLEGNVEMKEGLDEFVDEIKKSMENNKEEVNKKGVGFRSRLVNFYQKHKIEKGVVNLLAKVMEK